MSADHIAFKSFDELLDAARPQSGDGRWGGLWSREPKPRQQSPKEWSGTSSFEEAMKMAEGPGYPEGWRDIKKFSSEHGIDLGRMKTDFDIVHDLTGEMVDVGRFLECDPECMITLPDYHRQGRGRTIEIFFNMTTCCNQCGNLTCFVENPTGEAVTYRGMAVISLMNKLWDEGFNVELLGGFGSNDKSVIFPIIRSGEGLLDPHQLAYILMHPSAFRRIGLSVLENKFRAQDKSEYGEAFNFRDHGSDIYIPAQSLGFKDYEQAEKWVASKLALLKKRLETGEELTDEEDVEDEAIEA